MSRRAVLLGAVGAFVSALLGPGTARAFDHQPPRPRFDIRDSVSDAALDPPCVQCTYDEINLKVLLFGDLTFAELLASRLSELVPRIVPRIDQAAALGLLRDPFEAQALAHQLNAVAGDSSISDLFLRSRDEVSHATIDTLVALYRAGIRLPFPAQHSVAGERRAAVRQLLEHGGEFAYIDLYTRPKTDVPTPFLHALVLAKEVGLLAKAGNNRCCAHKGAKKDIECWLRIDDFCAQVVGAGTCIAGSDYCDGGGKVA